jgi:fluoride exporter
MIGDGCRGRNEKEADCRASTAIIRKRTTQGGRHVHVLMRIVLVALGSAIGGLTRWGVGEGFAYYLGREFPWGTFFINVTGSLFLGWFATTLAKSLPLQNNPYLRPDDLRLLVAVGFTGGYTTFSSYEYESHALLSAGKGYGGVLYMLGSVLLGLLAVRLGVELANRMP